jgi:hypothetical protein
MFLSRAVYVLRPRPLHLGYRPGPLQEQVLEAAKIPWLGISLPSPSIIRARSGRSGYSKRTYRLCSV